MENVVKLTRLDGLRGLASLIVVFSHLFLWFAPSAHYGKTSELNLGIYLFNGPASFFYRGGFAVYLFFILSGFVLTYSLQRNAHSLLTIRRASLKRYIRLGVPVAASIFICYLFMLLNVFQTPDIKPLTGLAKQYTFNESFLSATKDALFGALLLGDSRYNYVLWTISLELFGSLAIFSAIALFGHDKRTYQIACVIAICMLLTSTQRTYVCIGLFFIGSFMATIKLPSEPGARIKTAAILLILFGLYLAGYYVKSASYLYIDAFTSAVSTNFKHKTPWHILIPSLGATLIIAGVLLAGRMLDILDTRPLRWLGRISFSVYLLHSIVLAISAQIALSLMGVSYVSFAITTVATLIITLTASHFFHAKVDAPAISMSSKFADWVLSNRDNRPATVVAAR
ncbi:MAG: acyltransferase [Gammaproteobacteria bacterium HGW-Gammaproteobacteria-5]|nr:MAG: acyltransferase [Gammaproteobacteria bacterium HGW-Gammaproteobacteria-5]